MIKRVKVEKRQYPRIEKALPLDLAANGYTFATTTQNVSCIGTYCHIEKYIPPFTKVAIKMSLPILASARGNGSTVECQGVIVRTQDEERGGFNIAIFFNEINNYQRQKISQYISQFLPEKSPSS
jgi:hypothetical protein